MRPWEDYISYVGSVVDPESKMSHWQTCAESFRHATDSLDTVSKSMKELNTAFEERKNNMKVYYVKFEGSEKLYSYFCAPKVKLEIGGVYSIVADGITTYKNNVTVVKIINQVPEGHIRTITEAKLIDNAPRPDDKIEQVIFNYKKNTTVVLWKDGQKTIIKCQPGDEFDEEKALALCYMKRVLGNRGSFNETLKKYCNRWE